MGDYENALKNCTDAVRQSRRLEEHRAKNFGVKTLTVQTLERTLRAAGYRGSSLPFWGSLVYGGESYTGINVNEDTALNYIAYWACVRLLSGTLASLPCITLRRLEPRGKERATDLRLYRILHDEPNPEMDSFSFFESLMYHLVAADGNAYAYIDYESDLTTIKYLWLMRPDRITPGRDEKTKEIVYTYRFDDGERTIPAYRVWHIPGLGYDGLRGYTPLTMLRQAIGLGLATEKFGAKLFGNGTNLGGYLQHPGKMSDTAQERLKKSIQEKHEGLDNAHKLLVLEEGMTYTKNTINPEDAQFLETRKFQRSEIASFFGIPPHMIGDVERSTSWGSGIEEQSLGFLAYTMRPWMVRIERSANKKLFSFVEKESLFVEFLADALLRGNFESRTRGYWTQIQAGILSPNEARERDNMNPREGGDVYLQPVNMVPSGTLPAQTQPANNRDRSME